ncbi:Nectarin-1 [Capsicum chinense]|uniref:Germin-like protein n=1 Tax=Capsicum annuum TaxID=4072 RepID=A0A1U8HFW7_CAPAN|nr:nectarin-1 [Capsicum annuum]PHT62227.1 Nectarin-1 [Capsicum annuum]PHU10198.1 Nectarin-1 [Capsicum chinense]
MTAFRKKFPLIVVIMALLAINSDKACAGDPDMLQDLCVADLTSTTKLNGFPCKNVFFAADFGSLVLSRPGATNNTFGSLVTAANVLGIPGLNTLGVSMARIDYAPGGINAPHIHPRATEMIYVLQGQLDVGFITTANVLIAKRIVQGEVFVFPRGLVHFQKNNGAVPAAVIAGFNSQLPGTQSIATTLFGSSPPVPSDVLAQAFQIGTMQVEQIKAKFAPRK